MTEGRTKARAGGEGADGRPLPFGYRIWLKTGLHNDKNLV